MKPISHSEHVQSSRPSFRALRLEALTLPLLSTLCISSELGSWTWENVMGSSKDGWEWITDTERESQVV